MEELWDIYDADRVKTGRVHRRGEPISPGDYHLVVHVWIRSGDKYFITRRAPEKEVAPLIWEVTGGSALAGEDSLTAALREVKEETGITLRPENGVVFESLRREGKYADFADVWLFRQEVSLEDFVPQPGETIDAKLATPEELRVMVGEKKTFFEFWHMEPVFVFADILAREELLVCPPPGMDRAAIEALLAEDFHETGASGKTCSREEGVEALVRRSLVPPGEPWTIEGYSIHRLSETICLATFLLNRQADKTRRATVWRLEGGVWRAAYHQGTRCDS